MDKKLKHLIHQLKGKKFPDEMRYEFYPYAEEAYNVMYKAIKNSKFTEIQAANSLKIMVDLMFKAFPEKANELFDLASEFVGFENQASRSSVVGTLIAIYKISDLYPKKYVINAESKRKVMSLVQNAIDKGLDHDQLLYADNFIGEIKRHASK